MPNQKSKRIVVLQSSFNTAPVSSLSLTMDANFTVASQGTNKFEDVSANNSEDKTKYRMKFTLANGTDIGCITLRLVAKGDDVASGVKLNKTARSILDPAVVAGDVTLIDSPAASFERIWKQAVLDGSDVQFLDDVAKLDMRVSNASGYTVTQTVTTQANNQLVIGYSWNNSAGTAIVTGSVTLDSTVTAGAGYHLGSIRITDNNPTTGEERHR